MGTKTWTDEQLAEAIASSTTWPQVATKLGISPGGGGYLKTWANRLGLDYSHFTGRGDRTWTDQQLAEAIASSTTWFQVAAKLGLASWCRSQAKSRADRIGLVYRHFTEHKNRPWTDQQLAEAIASSTTWTQVATKLGMTPGGGGYLKTWANRLGLDYSHFKGHRDRTWTDEQFADAVATSKSWPQVRSKLGLAPTAMKMSSLRGHADRLDLECAHLSVRDRRKSRAQRPGTGSWFAALCTGMDTTIIESVLDHHLPDSVHDTGCALRCGYDGDDLSGHLARSILVAGLGLSDGVLVAGIRAVVKSNPHADTCGSMLSPGAGYPCSCWKADLVELIGG